MVAKRCFLLTFLSVLFVLSTVAIGGADDTCVFTAGVSEDAKPNVVLLFDTGAVMEEVNWHTDYDNTVDYSPVTDEANQFDVIGSLPISTTAGYLKLTDVTNPDDFTKSRDITVGGVAKGQTIAASFWDSVGRRLYFDGMDPADSFNVGETIYNQGGTGKIVAVNMGGYNGFYNPHGYAINVSGSSAYLVKVLPDLSLDAVGNGILATSFDAGTKLGTWVINGRTLTLSTGSDGTGTGHETNNNTVIHDNAADFRYSANYLNWLFFAQDGGGGWLYDGSSLERESRLYSAKMALITVIKKGANRVKFSLYQFTGDNGATQKQPLKDALNTVDPVDWHNSVLESEFWTNIDSMASNAYSPLAEGLMTVGGYFNSQASHLAAEVCQKNFVIVVTSGLSSMDRGDTGGGSPGCLGGSVNPACLADYDADLGAGGTITVLDGSTDPNVGYEVGNIVMDKSFDLVDNDNDGSIDEEDNTERYVSPIPYNWEGSTNFDDLAYYLYSHDMSDDVDGFQNIYTYTIGYMGSELSNAFLINASNNGNGNLNLYDVHHPDYGKFHFEVKDPAALAEKLDAALAAILERTNAFAAPVVPVTRTTSGDRIYMSFFTPREVGLWEGNVVKFGLGSFNQIVDKNGDDATYPNGALKPTAEPFWSTIVWANDSTSEYPAANGIHNTARRIYTYLGDDVDLTAEGDESLGESNNAFKDDNSYFNAEILGNPDPTRVTLAEVINFVRGADVFDVNEDGDTTENRSLITADILHSEPAVYEFLYSKGTILFDPATVEGTFEPGEVLVGNGGGVASCVAAAGGDIVGDPDVYSWSLDTETYTPLAYKDLEAPFTVGEVVVGSTSGAKGTIVASTDRTMIFFGANDGMLHAVSDVDGREVWGFVPPDLLSSLKDMILGDGHQFYVDSSAKIYLKDLNGDGVITDEDDDGVWEDTDDQVILVCGERKGGKSYFALDITDPYKPKYMWRLSGEAGPSFDDRVIVNSDLGESWSEPRFAKVKTSDGDTDGMLVVIVGGGYTSDQTAGNVLLFANATTGAVVKVFKSGNGSLLAADDGAMNYGFASKARIIDSDGNGFLDKIYIGDVGGQMWRFGKFTDAVGDPLPFPQVDENITNWYGQRLFVAGCNESNCTDPTDNNANGLLNELRAFYYPPAVTLERGYDLVFMASGDRENPCVYGTNDQVYVVKDYNNPSTAALTVDDLVEGCTPSADSYNVEGWYYSLPEGEKVLSEMLVFLGHLYFTTFLPSDDPCAPGGYANLYVLDYDTGCETVPVRRIGTGIASRVVLVVRGGLSSLLVSIGGGNLDGDDGTTDDTTDGTSDGAAGVLSGSGPGGSGAGVYLFLPEGKKANFFYRWWRELVN